jgi:phosphoribosylcarboxyaminoimidazole (NCAIR) mutase
LAETALAPKVQGDITGTVQVGIRATVASAGDAAHLQAPVARRGSASPVVARRREPQE